MTTIPKYYICENLTENSVKLALRKGCKGIIYYSSEILAVNNLKLELIYAGDYDRQGFKFQFDDNKNKLHKLRLNYPSFFKLDDIDILDACNKDLFWATRIQGMLNYVANLYLLQGNEIVKQNRISSEIKNIAKLSYNIFLFFLRNFGNNKERVITFEDRKFGFLVAGNFQIDYYHYLIEAIGVNNCVFFVKPEYYKEACYNFKSLCIKKISIEDYGVKISLPFIIKSIKELGLDRTIKLLEIKRNLLIDFRFNRRVLQSKAKALFLIAQENSGKGNLLAQQARKIKVITVNSHNGIKYKDVQNRDNCFDIWCVWDDMMKDLLVKHCDINKDQLVVTGHFKQDHISNYKYQNYFNDFLEGGEKVISVFSTPVPMDIKVATVDYLQKKYANDNVKIIVRLHPSESISDWRNLKQSLSLKFVLASEDKKYKENRLYEQLSISSICIVFGSTVALESKWFSVPCITFEQRDESFIYNIDNEILFHVKTIEALEEKVAVLLNRKVSNIKASIQSVADVVVGVVYEKLLINNNPKEL